MGNPTNKQTTNQNIYNNFIKNIPDFNYGFNYCFKPFSSSLAFRHLPKRDIFVLSSAIGPLHLTLQTDHLLRSLLSPPKNTKINSSELDSVDLVDWKGRAALVYSLWSGSLFEV